MQQTLRTIMAAVALMTTLTLMAERRTDVFQTPSGKTVKITNIKHASIQIEYDGRFIYFDPEGTLQPTIDYADFPKANYIFVTHEHHDHFDREAIAQLRFSGTNIYTNPAVQRSFSTAIALANGDSLAIDTDIAVAAVPAYNTTEGRDQFHPKGRDNGYVLTLDGLRIYVAGDTEDIPEMVNLKAIDIAFLPCNQPYTMTPEQLARAAKIIKPRVLYPYHYNNTPLSKLKMLLVGTGIEVRIRDYQ